jgi:ubiquinone/menaquinone biosynthesis C-methylase UbiE
MLDRIVEYMRCVRCGGTRVQMQRGGVACRDCDAHFPRRDGILDLLGEDAKEVITPFQRLMQTPLLVSIYERMWRRLGYFVASSRSFDKEIQTILRFKQGPDADRILDLACGTGVFTRPLAARTRGLVVGLDMSWPMLRHARRLLARDGSRNIILMHGTAFRLPFISGAFQHVNCCGALHLFDRPEMALREIGRVLHPAGQLSVQTTIRPEHSGGLAYVLERFIRFGFFREIELRELVRLHGMKILDQERHRISYSFLARHARALPR